MLNLIKISRCLESYDYVMAIKIGIELKFPVKLLPKKKKKKPNEGRTRGALECPPREGSNVIYGWFTMLVDLLVEFMILIF